MFKKILAALLALFAAAAFAAVDVNKATQAELDGVKGIGPAISGRIVDARKTGAFKDWPDLIERVKGIGEVNAAKFSDAGLTVNGTTYTKTAAAATKKAGTKTADTKAADTKADTKTAAKSEDSAASAPADKKTKKSKKAKDADAAASAPAKK